MMQTIGVLKNTVQEYAWGSYTAIPELLGEAFPGDKPQAELWMGAHPKAPSLVNCDGKWTSLLVLIKKDPEAILGKTVAERFNNGLPFLFKVLAIATSLSIQAHPSRTQASLGFARENEQGISLNAPDRNYKDENHKPECICALTTFWALNGFRKIAEIRSRMEKICAKGLDRELDDLGRQPNSAGLKGFFQGLMKMDAERKKKVISEALKNAKMLSKVDQAFQWMVSLYNAHPTDIGVFAPVFLNLICLEPGQAMFLPPGELHAYLDGVGIELMANSDNVLRGGLTPKHIDVPELLKVLNFEERNVNILRPQEISATERVYSSMAAEFVLSVISVQKGLTHLSAIDRNIEILLCMAGNGCITDLGTADQINISRGTSVMIPSAVNKYIVEGTATIYKATVPTGNSKS